MGIPKYSTKYYRQLLLLLPTLIFLLNIGVGCGDVSPTIVESVWQTPQVPTEPIATPNDWEYRWLKGIPCAPPCWEGITPGVTGLKEAMSILGKNPLIKDIKSIGPTTNQEYGLITWFFTKENKRSFARYDATLSEQAIYRIEPEFTKSFVFGDILKAYGEPSHISIGAGYTVSTRLLSYHISVVYLSKGFAVSTGGSNFAEKVTPLLTPNLTFVGFELFSPDIDKQMAKAVQGFVKWEGFKGFEYYCRDLNDDTGKSDCSKTLKPTP